MPEIKLNDIENAQLEKAWEILITIMTKYNLGELRSIDSRRTIDLKVTILESPVNDY